MSGTIGAGTPAAGDDGDTQTGDGEGFPDDLNPKDLERIVLDEEDVQAEAEPEDADAEASGMAMPPPTSLAAPLKDLQEETTDPVTSPPPTPSAQRSVPGGSAWTLRIVSNVEALSHLLDPGGTLRFEFALRRTGGHKGVPNPLEVMTTVPNQFRQRHLKAKVLEPGFSLTGEDDEEFYGTIQLEHNGSIPLSLEGLVIQLFSEDAEPMLVIDHELFPKESPAESPAPPPSAAARSWKWPLGAGMVTVAIVVLISWFFQVTWGATIGAIALALAAIWGMNVLRQRVSLTGNNVAAMIAAATLILICLGGIKRLIAPSETMEEEVAASTTDAPNENEATETDAATSRNNVVVPPGVPIAVPPAPVADAAQPAAPATVTGVPSAPPAPVAPPASPPAPKPTAPAAEKPPEPKGPPATLLDTENCEAILRPNSFSQSDGKFGAVCGKGAQRGVYRVDSSKKVDGKYVHKDLHLLPGVKPPTP